METGDAYTRRKEARCFAAGNIRPVAGSSANGPGLHRTRTARILARDADSLLLASPLPAFPFESREFSTISRSISLSVSLSLSFRLPLSLLHVFSPFPPQPPLSNRPIFPRVAIPPADISGERGRSGEKMTKQRNPRRYQRAANNRAGNERGSIQHAQTEIIDSFLV